MLLHGNINAVLVGNIVMGLIFGFTGQDSKAGDRFMRAYWYEAGIEHGNPSFNSRFRVNAPETSLHPSYMHRSEARANGMMVIFIEEDLSKLDGAELYLEIWGGHPGTASKRVTINGRSTYALPEVGTADKNCTHMYPVIPLELTDLVNGYNVIQFACDKGSTFWGHFIVDNACLRVALKSDHPDLSEQGVAKFRASVAAIPALNSETIDLSLSCLPSEMDAVSSVDFLGYYYGYNENGSTMTTDWHGFSKKRESTGIIGTSREQPFKITWDISMIPEQKDMMVQAVVHFKDSPNTTYITSATGGLRTPERKQSKVALYASEDLPKPFWSRANRRNGCTINLDMEPEHIQRAELHVVIWDGGRGKVENPFVLNGHAIPVVGKGRHDVLYRKLEIDLALLKKGDNEITLLSDTEHHGIEILLPGPALMVRSKAKKEDDTR